MNDKKDAEAVELRGRETVGAGRLGVYTALGAALGTVPLPWLPDSVARRVRGALAQDVAARHGLSLAPEAREVLAEPEPRMRARGIVGQAMKYATSKLLARFTPLGFLPPLRAGAQTFALGHLLHRYFETRTDRALRVDAVEARVVRAAIDEAFLVALRGELRVETGPRFAPPEELRDNTTQLVDGFLIAAASVPDWLVRRLNAAFDAALDEERARGPRSGDDR